MGYAKNIGRLGALAVALGVGYGAADMPAAFADNGDSGSSAPSNARTHTRSASPAGVDNSAGPAQHRDSAPRAAASVKASVVKKSTPVSAAAVAAHTPAPTAAVADVPAPAPAPAAAAPAAQAAPAATTVAPAPAAAAVTPQPAASVPKPIARFGSLVSAALAPLLTNHTGGAPGQSPLLFSVLAWARKEFERVTGVTPPSAEVSNAQTQSPNLIVNPGAELSTPSGSAYSAVTMPGWAVTGTPTVIQYGTPRVLMPLGISQSLPFLPSIWSFPKAKNGATDGGKQFFGGGNVADSSMTQTIDLSAAGAAIDGGDTSYNLSGWLGGYSFDRSATTVQVTFLDADKNALGTSTIGPVTGLNRLWAINLLQRSTSGVLPVGTRFAKVDVDFHLDNPVKIGFSADYNDAYADNLSFTIGADLPAPPDPTPPVSMVGALDHVYMVYMENKGYNDLLGSPNAPFLNSLINTYGFANNYFALTHGSLPNYYPIIGGDNFGVTWNCATACIDVPKADTLPGQLDAAGLTWRSYAQSLEPGASPLVSAGDYAFDETGFPAFQFIFDDEAYAKEHIVPLEQMAVDLQSTDTSPAYAWFAANEDFNGEGPVDNIQGMLKFVVSLLTTHQYNVPALDQYLSETVPVIMNSNSWASDESSVIVVTLDEDTNNTSLGFGNQGNHVVTVVIPNQAAIDAGMRPGHFLATNQYDHYSLLRTIEESLGLPGQLTQNDKYAFPMNEFWV